MQITSSKFRGIPLSGVQIFDMEMLIILVLQREVQWRRPLSCFLFRSTFSYRVAAGIDPHVWIRA